MEEKKGVKVSLNVVIAIIVVLLIIAVIAVLVLRLKEEGTMAQKNMITSNTTRSPQITTPIQKKTAKGDFAIKFLQMENEKKNIVYNPLSIKYALNMLKEGANGNTKAQIENAIKGLNLPKYNNKEKVLSLANSVYVRDTYKQDVKNEYKNTLMGKYNAEINYDTFRNAANINKWIEEKTLGIIKNMLSDDLVQDAKMILINALAIDMEWELPFDCNDTNGNEFKLADGSTMKATTLHNEIYSENVSYYKDDSITALTMNLKKYDDIQLDFTAIMPEEDLSKYINDFTTEKFNNIKERLVPASETAHGIKISIPKFSFEYNLELKKDLIQLGITDAFDAGKADFTNMTNNPIGLYVDEALHKADIEFTEKGVKAAAVTVMAMMESAYIMPYEQIELKFDKPFLFVISDKSSGEIWFLGTVYEPNSWEKEQEEYSK